MPTWAVKMRGTQTLPDHTTPAVSGQDKVLHSGGVGDGVSISGKQCTGGLSCKQNRYISTLQASEKEGRGQARNRSGLCLPLRPFLGVTYTISKPHHPTRRSHVSTLSI